MIGSFTLYTESSDQSCNLPSIMITISSRAGLAESSTPGDQGSEAKGTVMLKSLSTSLIVRGILAVIVGVIALAWPGPTALVLVLIVGVWAIVAGLVEIAAAFGHGEAAGTRARFILGGLITVAFGVVLCARPGLGVVTLALLFG